MSGPTRGNDQITVTRPRLHLSHDSEYDYLSCVEFGRTEDGHHPDGWLTVSRRFGYMLDEPDGRAVGFRVNDFSEFDPQRMPEVWGDPRFDCPALGLSDASAGEICLAAAAQLEGDTINRRAFGLATALDDPEDAAPVWKQVIEAGDMMGHYGLGYTLLEGGDVRGAYKHLRVYTEVARWSPWAWNYRGQAAEAMGERTEARDCYRRTLRLERLHQEQTDAAERLEALGER